MMRKIIGKIIELIIPRVEEGMEAEEGATEEGGEKPKTRVITLDQILGGGAQMAPKEPDLRVIGLYADVSDEKVAELTQAILWPLCRCLRRKGRRTNTSDPLLE
jgi:hypothetical protein